jgi:hypothetical protein
MKELVGLLIKQTKWCEIELLADEVPSNTTAYSCTDGIHFGLFSHHQTAYLSQ